MKNKETTGQIIPIYDGNFASKMVWDEARLAQICQVADLRTKINISAGEANPEKQQENLGDILAWKRIIDLRQMFTISADNQGLVETTEIEDGEASVIINYRRVTDYLQSKSKDRFDEKLFVNTFDGLAKTGIANIIAREKLAMTGESTIWLGLNGLVFGSLAGIGYLGMSGFVTDHVFEIPSVPFNLDDDVFFSYYNYLSSRFIEGAIGVTCLMGAAKWVTLVKSELPELDPYFLTNNDDLNPLKHIANFTVSQLTLRSKPIVRYQE